MLASQAAKVNRIIGEAIRVVDVRFVDIRAIIRNSVRAIFSTHSREEIRCVRYIVIPIMLSAKIIFSINRVMVIVAGLEWGDLMGRSHLFYLN